jgi:hypothetical protein
VGGTLIPLRLVVAKEGRQTRKLLNPTEFFEVCFRGSCWPVLLEVAREQHPGTASGEVTSDEVTSRGGGGAGVVRTYSHSFPFTALEVTVVVHERKLLPSVCGGM